MAKNKVKTKKKGLVNVDELNAWKVAYSEPVGMSDYAKYVWLPAFLVGGFSFLLLYYFWLSLLMAVVGAIYGATFYMPNAIRRDYEIQSFNERNKFINNMTQILTDETKTVPSGLIVATRRSKGKFKEDLIKLQARISGADTEQMSEGFAEMIKEYEDDIIFVQYMEQMETTAIEGRTNIDTLKDIKSYHNDVKKKQEEYFKIKKGHLNDMKILMGVILIFVIAVTFSFGFDVYIEAFARTFIGWVTMGIYMLVMGYHFKKFSTYLFDDSIMEVKK